MTVCIDTPSTSFVVSPVTYDRWAEHCQSLSIDAYLFVRRTPFFLTPSAISRYDDIAQLSGFSGSQACLLWSPLGHSVLYTDDRYEIQARQEFTQGEVVNIQLMEHDIRKRVKGALGMNAWTWTAHEANTKDFARQAIWDHSVVSWRDDGQTLTPIYGLPNPISFQAKCQDILGCDVDQDDAWIVCDPCLVSWWMNARSLDHPMMPVVYGYLLIQRHRGRYSGVLCVSWPRTVRDLDPDIHVVPWELGMTLLCALTEKPCADSDAGVPEWLRFAPNIAWNFDPKKTPQGLVQPHWTPSSFLDKASTACSIKNPWEQHHIRCAHTKDSVAWIQWLNWLYHIPELSHETEQSAAQQLASWRAQHSTYVGPSFSPISAMGGHSAMIHYSPNPDKAPPLGEGLYLMDSGGQYRYGTTDVTRTMWLGNMPPPLHIQRVYTTVLQALIHGLSLRFPADTTGSQMDALVRSFMWQQGWDYPHATGHGVGAFLSVHESPPTLAKRSTQPLLQGHVMSIEPGYYQATWGGVRLENVVMVSPDSSHENWLSFDSLTMVPFDRRLIISGLLSYAHRQWLDRYHRHIYHTLSSSLTPDARQWLYHHTRTLDE